VVNGSLILSYDFSMIAAWARGTAGNLFPLFSNTAFRLTFEESINTMQLDHVGVQEPL
jgi:hypothetical protein